LLVAFRFWVLWVAILRDKESWCLCAFSCIARVATLYFTFESKEIIKRKAQLVMLYSRILVGSSYHDEKR
jgi:hypothetical protein